MLLLGGGGGGVDVGVVVVGNTACSNLCVFSVSQGVWKQKVRLAYTRRSIVINVFRLGQNTTFKTCFPWKRNTHLYILVYTYMCVALDVLVIIT